MSENGNENGSCQYHFGVMHDQLAQGGVLADELLERLARIAKNRPPFCAVVRVNE